MRLSLKHSLGFMSVVAMYAPTEVCETGGKEMFYAKLDSVLDQCPHRDALIVRIAGSWYQRPALHLWNSNARAVAKEIDHILVSTC